MGRQFEFNNPYFKYRRRELRKNQTDVERLLWNQLRRKQFEGLRFCRQYSVGPYILDFYCPEKRLAIELDGGQHDEESSRVYDQERTDYLAEKLIRVLRFWNNEVMGNLEGVLEKIREETGMANG